MRFMETSLMVYDYPEPSYNNERAIRARVFVSYDLEIDIPSDWDEDKTIEYVRDNFNDFNCLSNETIEDIEIGYF